MPTEHVTVRIPELPAHAALNEADALPIWSSADNRTRQTPLGVLMQFLGVGGSGGMGSGTGTVGNSAAKGKYIFDATQAQITAGGDGKTIHLPQFAGKNYTLTADSKDFLDSEYEVLQSGGFKILIAGYQINPGVRFSLQFAEPIPTDPGTGQPTQGTGGGPLFTGKLPVSANTPMGAADAGKLVQLRGGANAITLTLPDISAVPALTLVVVEAAINNQKENRIQTQNGQFIYLNNTSQGGIGIRAGECAWLVADSDGWYVVNDFGAVYRQVGFTFDTYATGLNELPLMGQTVARADYPRLWEWVQTLGDALVSENDWPNNRGCFSNGNGTTTFRLPDWRDMFTRTVGDGRAVGSYQEDMLEAHTHPFSLPTDGQPGAGNRRSIVDSDNADEGPVPAGNTGPTGGEETRPKNIGLIKAIKV